MNRVKSLLSMRCILLGYSFKPRPNSRTLGTATSVLTIGLSMRSREVPGYGCFKGLTHFRESPLLHLMDSGSSSKMASRTNDSLGKLIRISTSFPGFALLLRERTLIAAGHVNPRNLGANKNLPYGRGSKV